MNVIRAKCPNCWETDDCEVVETTNWTATVISVGETKVTGQAAAGGYNLKCPTCHDVFWHEVRGGAEST